MSIIIPVYNAEEYLEECIQSLLNQSFHDCEFIFINDGSTDNSKNIIDKYRENDERIKLINQQNKGVSEARNRGILNAKGKYITFVDADDYVDQFVYEKIYNLLEDNDWDVIIYNIEEEIEGHKNIIKYNIVENQTLEKKYLDEYIMPMFIREDKMNSVCNKIYKNSVVCNYNIKFPKNVSLGEDCIFNINFFSKISKFGYMNYIGYHYREVKNSATRSIDIEDILEKALNIYRLDYNKMYYIEMSSQKINELKSIRLINTIKSYIYIIFKSDYRRVIKRKYINRILYNEDIQAALSIYKKNNRVTTKYERVMIYGIEKKMYFLLEVICMYSRIRNAR